MCLEPTAARGKKEREKASQERERHRLADSSFAADSSRAESAPPPALIAADMDAVRWVLGPCGVTQLERHAAEITVHSVEVRLGKKNQIYVTLSPIHSHVFLFPPRTFFSLFFSLAKRVAGRGSGSRGRPRSLFSAI